MGDRSKILSTANEVWTELRNPSTALLKVTYFCLFSGVVMLWVQLQPFQISIRLASIDTSNVSVAGSCMIIIGPLLCGIIGDTTGNYKPVVATTCILTGLVALSFAFLPSWLKLNEKMNVTGLQNNVSTINESWDVPSGSPADVLNASLDMKACTVWTNITNSTIVNFQTERLAFWAYIILHSLYMLLSSATVSLFDSAILHSVKSKGVDYGSQRAFGTIAALSSAPVGGVLVEIFSMGNVPKDYRVLFCTGFGLFAISSLLLLKLDVTYERDNVFEPSLIGHLVKQSKFLVLICITISGGLFAGYMESQMYRFLSELGLSAIMVSATVTVGGSVEILLQLVSSKLVRCIGTFTILFVSFVCYSVRFFGLYVLTNPMWALVLEVLDSVSSGLFFTVIVIEIGNSVSGTVLASTRGLFGTAHMGIGALIGSSMSAVLVSTVGVRTGWALMGVASAAVASLMSFKIIVSNIRRRSKSLNVSSENSSNDTNNIYHIRYIDADANNNGPE